MNLARRLVFTALTAASAGSASAQARLFGVDGHNLLELDPSNGVVMASTPLLGGPAGTIGALAYDAGTDTLFATSNSFGSLWTLDYGTGTLTLIGPFHSGASFPMHGLEVDETGQLYGFSPYDVSLGASFLRVDRATAQCTPISTPGAWVGLGLGFDSTTGTMYLADPAFGRLMTIDRTTGATSIVGPLGASGHIGTGMAYAEQYGMYAVNNTGTDSLWRLDLTTGAATFISDLPTNNMIALAFVGGGTTGVAFCPGDGSGTACPCGNSSAPGSRSGCLSSLNAGGKLVAYGLAQLTNDTVVLWGSNMPNSSALYFQGTLQQSGGSGAVFGDGLRCASGSIARLGSTTNAGDSSQYPFGGSLPVHVKGNVAAPGTRTYQVWYRNAAAFCTPSTFNLTNGWELSWAP